MNREQDDSGGDLLAVRFEIERETAQQLAVIKFALNLLLFHLYQFTLWQPGS